MEADSFVVTSAKLLFVIFLVFLNGFFVATEFALVKVRESRITQLITEGSLKAKRVDKLLHQLDAYLSATQLGITLASLGLGWVGEPALSHLIQPFFAYVDLPDSVVSTISIVIGFLIITFLHIVLGELAPKSLAIQRPEQVSMFVARPMEFFYIIMYPFIKVLNGAAFKVLGIFGIEAISEHVAAHTEEEIRILVNESHKSGLIDQTEMMFVENIFDFSETTAREIMVPRPDMMVLDISDDFQKNLDIVSEGTHTRYPVINGDKDHIVGILHIKDILTYALQANKQDRSLESIVRPALLVPETLSIDNLFGMMQKKRHQVAVLIDEYGGTAGLITLEDIIEEIVGDIQDEFDNERPEIEQVHEEEEDIISLDGRLLLSEVNAYLHTSLYSDEVDTIAGWICTKTNQTPAVGMKVKEGKHEFEVAEVDHLRITRVLVKTKKN
ncbi:hemolysin family protein [Brevibacillus daliensis]|uniref:hemolysin family protein n=1 Tax=Brevibacillus daliensis TaxID=2892995 RepID=UPI001E60D887|nr:hemolysin family protein [Brevibacillus daliensis]